MNSSIIRSCIISCEVVGPFSNGGIGTHCFYLAKFLSRQMGQEVTFVYTGEIEKENEEYWREWFQRELEIRFIWISPHAASERPPVGLKCHQVGIARRVFEWLRSQTFDVCYFQEMLGHGYRCFQAKRLGLAFQNTVLTCMLHSSWEWICQAMQMFPTYGADEMQTKYMERYCIENCDIAISPSEYMFQWARTNCITVPANNHVLPYLLDSGLHRVSYEPPSGKIVFFGRLEARKGLVLFLETLCELERRGNLSGRQLHITFLGKVGFTIDGNAATTIENYRSRFSPAIKVMLKTDLGHHQAIEFLLANRDALVVCPSLLDNSPYAVIECLQLGVNIIAAKSGGIPELFADEARLFEPEPEAFAEKIEAALSNQLQPPVKRHDAERAAQLWGDFGRKTVFAFRPRLAPSGTPRVQVFVPVNGSCANLEGTLRALQEQTFKNYFVTVVHERTAHACASAFADARKRFGASTWSFIELDDPACPVAIPEGVDYIAFLNSNCVPKPQWIEQMVTAVQFSGLDALTCCAEVQLDGDGATAPTRLHEALGACLEAGAYANMFGLGCVLVKTALAPKTAAGLRQPLLCGGLWTFIASLVLSGKQCDAHPDSLVHVTAASGSITLGNLNYAAHAGVLKHYAQGFPPWIGRLLTNAVASEINLAKLTNELKRARGDLKAAYAPGQIIRKVRRETVRILEQIKRLGRRFQRAKSRLGIHKDNRK